MLVGLFILGCSCGGGSDGGKGEYGTDSAENLQRPQYLDGLEGAGRTVPEYNLAPCDGKNYLISGNAVKKVYRTHPAFTYSYTVRGCAIDLNYIVVLRGTKEGRPQDQVLEKHREVSVGNSFSYGNTIIPADLEADYEQVCVETGQVGAVCFEAE